MADQPAFFGAGWSEEVGALAIDYGGAYWIGEVYQFAGNIVNTRLSSDLGY